MNGMVMIRCAPIIRMYEILDTVNLLAIRTYPRPIMTEEIAIGIIRTVSAAAPHLLFIWRIRVDRLRENGIDRRVTLPAMSRLLPMALSDWETNEIVDELPYNT